MKWEIHLENKFLQFRNYNKLYHSLKLMHIRIQQPRDTNLASGPWTLFPVPHQKKFRIPLIPVRNTFLTGHYRWSQLERPELGRCPNHPARSATSPFYTLKEFKYSFGLSHTPWITSEASQFHCCVGLAWLKTTRLGNAFKVSFISSATSVLSNVKTGTIVIGTHSTQAPARVLRFDWRRE